MCVSTDEFSWLWMPYESIGSLEDGVKMVVSLPTWILYWELNSCLLHEQTHH